MEDGLEALFTAENAKSTETRTYAVFSMRSLCSFVAQFIFGCGWILFCAFYAVSQVTARSLNNRLMGLSAAGVSPHRCHFGHVRGDSPQVPLHEPFTHKIGVFRSDPVKPGQSQSNQKQRFDRGFPLHGPGFPLQTFDATAPARRRGGRRGFFGWERIGR
jgi:hypothetical protein